MPEFGEVIAVPDAGMHVEEKCPFCPVDKQKRDLTSYIGKDNDSTKLASKLTANSDPKSNHLYFDVEFEIYRRYSAEAHHLICGNEVMKEEGEIEKYLIHTSKKTSQGSAGFLDPNDVGYDINNAKNGIWLPSVPDIFRKADGEPDFWWGDQSDWNRKNPTLLSRVSIGEWQRGDAAFIVMEAVKRQFHKGPHEDVGDATNNYVVMAISRLRQVTVFLEHFAENCPMENDGSKRKQPPYVPPYGIIALLDLLSKSLAKELKGHPGSWNYYISEFALQCSQWWKRQSVTE